MFFYRNKKSDSLTLKRENTANLTGHRPKYLPWGYDETKHNCLMFKKDLKVIFEGAIKYGLHNFLIGMAEGFDMIGAEVLLELRKIYKFIKVIAVIPCIGQEKKWKFEQQVRYNNILKQCNQRIILSSTYTTSCMNERNKFMVEHASVCIACWNGKPSGTANTIRYAKENGCKIKIINPENYR